VPDILPETLQFHLEHIVARQHGGRTASENLAWACHRCNERKGPNLTGIDPDTSAVVPLFHPRRDRWEEHFAWDKLTVVWLLEMNSEVRLRWRAALRRHSLF
jgi:hypothetical protein